MWCTGPRLKCHLIENMGKFQGALTQTLGPKTLTSVTIYSKVNGHFMDASQSEQGFPKAMVKEIGDDSGNGTQLFYKEGPGNDGESEELCYTVKLDVNATEEYLVMKDKFAAAMIKPRKG